jgi:hypothetical protein
VNYNTQSAKQIIGKVYRDLQIDDSNWEADAIEWIGEGMDLIGGVVPVEKRQEIYGVESHKLTVPSDMAFMEALFLMKGVSFTYNGSTLSFDVDEAKESQKYRIPRQGNGAINYQNSSPLHDGVGSEGTDRRVANITESYELNPGIIQTSFERGLVVLAYKGFMTDDEGYPLVPDDATCKEALFWHIVKKLMLRGYQHKQINYKVAEQKYKDYAGKARRKAKMPDIDEYDHFMRSWLRFVDTRHRGRAGRASDSSYGQAHVIDEIDV